MNSNSSESSGFWDDEETIRVDGVKRYLCQNGCGRDFASRAGMSSHQRRNNCTRLPTPQRVIPPYIRPLKQTNTSSDITPNELLMIATPGNKFAPREDDDYSVISAQLENFQIPNDLITDYEHTPAREDERVLCITDFVQEMVERRPLVRKLSFGTMVLNTGYVFLILLDHVFKFVIIFFFFLAIYYCQNGECDSQIHKYYMDTEKVNQIFDNI